MKTDELIKIFKDKRRPICSAAAFLGVHENTVRAWIRKDGVVPEQWAALFQVKIKNKETMI